MPFCPQCGAQLPEGAQFCGSCGTPLAPPTQPAAQAAPKPGKKNKTGIIIVLVLVLLAAAVTAWLLWRGQVVEGGPTPPDVPIATSPGTDWNDMSDVPSLEDLRDAETLPPGFQRLEDMDPEERATYLENLNKQ